MPPVAGHNYNFTVQSTVSYYGSSKSSRSHGFELRHTQHKRFHSCRVITRVLTGFFGSETDKKSNHNWRYPNVNREWVPDLSSQNYYVCLTPVGFLTFLYASSVVVGLSRLNNACISPAISDKSAVAYCPRNMTPEAEIKYGYDRSYLRPKTIKKTPKQGHCTPQLGGEVRRGAWRSLVGILSMATCSSRR